MPLPILHIMNKSKENDFTEKKSHDAILLLLV